MFINDAAHTFSEHPRSTIKSTNTYNTSENWRSLSWKMCTFWASLEIIEKVNIFKITELKQLEILEQSYLG